MSLFESRMLHGADLPPLHMAPRPDTGCGVPVALPDFVPTCNPETDTRGGIERVAEKIRIQAAKNGRDMTHTDAVTRVQAARTRGDRIRAGGNR